MAPTAMPPWRGSVAGLSDLTLLGHSDHAGLSARRGSLIRCSPAAKPPRASSRPRFPDGWKPNADELLRLRAAACVVWAAARRHASRTGVDQPVGSPQRRPRDVRGAAGQGLAACSDEYGRSRCRNPGQPRRHCGRARWSIGRFRDARGEEASRLSADRAAPSWRGATAQPCRLRETGWRSPRRSVSRIEMPRR